VEYTPQAFLQSDLDIFNEVFAPDLVGVSPDLVSIDGGEFFLYNSVDSLIEHRNLARYRTNRGSEFQHQRRV